MKNIYLILLLLNERDALATMHSQFVVRYKQKMKYI
jgi:hypothetical protein